MTVGGFFQISTQNPNGDTKRDAENLLKTFLVASMKYRITESGPFANWKVSLKSSFFYLYNSIN